jgi:colanic acid biosynthesis glycosyl transferase WcaI
MKILIVTDSYPPEVRSSALLMKELAEGLAKGGHTVSAITSYPSHNVVGEQKKIPPVSMEGGVEIVRVKVLPHHNVNFLVRGIAQLTMPYLFFFKVKQHIKEIDAVIVHSPPLPLAATARLVQKTYRAKYILNLHDIFPQNAVDLGVLTNQTLVKFFSRMERRAYRAADLIITPSEKHKAFLREKRNVLAKDIEVIPHWIDPKPFRDAKQTGKFKKKYGIDENAFVFLFGGVLGPSQELSMIIYGAAEQRERKNIHILFVGEGTEKKKLIALTNELKLKNVHFQPLVSGNEYPSLLKDADVGLVTLTSKNTTPALPAKLMGYMAASLPVLALLHRESQGIEIVREAKCGYAARSDEGGKAAELMTRMYEERNKMSTFGENGHAYLMKHFTQDVCMKKWNTILHRIIPSERKRAGESQEL